MKTLDQIRAEIKALKTIDVTQAKDGDLFLHPDFEALVARVLAVKDEIKEFQTALKALDEKINEEIGKRFDDDCRKVAGEQIAITRVYRKIREFASREAALALLDNPATAGVVKFAVDGKAVDELAETPEGIVEEEKFSHYLARGTK